MQSKKSNKKIDFSLSWTRAKFMPFLLGTEQTIESRAEVDFQSWHP
jgi:hypothetical protein